MALRRPILIPTLARPRIAVGDVPDANWATTQVAPGAALLLDVTGLSVVGFFFVPYEADGTTVSSGTLDLQLVAVSATAPPVAGAPKTLVWATPVDATVAPGALVTYDVRLASTVAIRVAAKALAGGAAYVEVYCVAERST